MEIAFESRKLRRLCEEEAYALDVFGSTISDQLKHRLADLRAASTVDDLVVGNPRLANSQEFSNMKIDVFMNCYILFGANHVNNPMTKKRSIDWLRVRRIKILEIECQNG